MFQPDPEMVISTDKNAKGYFYGVFYVLNENSEWNFLAAFQKKEDAEEYSKRNVWSHLKLVVSRQPVY